ncbi:MULTISPECIES: hypothetical protein [unclassified Uliginosibacterium]|uniref:hypothetical protein n=1 Tax=unclassified Uliginosibacterium TaxID=2621521 RepID=UPI000C7D3CC8|nr:MULTISPECIES: hypothetical protein [unclassified Uliginosibacterium]MDO6387538.1 hypothetical protein [Uliginosibacterium sp. 31-12]PLK47414.1 hypothetical protein C0V76_17315 [Uliginosibacterium sp. TH139]
MTDTALPISLRGDLLLRKSRRWGLFALLALLLTLPCVLFMKPLWSFLITLGSGSFMLMAGLWGLILAAGPLAFLACGLAALFLRVEARFAPRSRQQPFSDTLAISFALLLSFLPALAALYPPVKAILTGYIGFRGLGQQYPLASDPYGFWQAVAFWFMGAATLAFLAGLYWRGKWRAHRTATTTAAA